MKATVKLQLLIGPNGRVIGAQGASTEAGSKDDVPTAQIEPMPGQQVVTTEVPAPILKLSGSDMARYLSEIRVNTKGEVSLPNITIKHMEH